MSQKWDKRRKIWIGSICGLLGTSVLASSITVGVLFSPSTYHLPISRIQDSQNNNISTYYDLYQDSLNYQVPWYARKVLAKKFGQHYFQSWYDSTSSGNWNLNKQGQLINAHCNSEQQALMLYANYWGDFWNYELHQAKIPTNKVVNLNRGYFKDVNLEVKGNDFKYIYNALKRAISPVNFVVYHGVEFMENEFYDQLKNDIKPLRNNQYDYSQTIGKTIQTYGFLSATFNYQEAYDFSYGVDWVNGGTNLPLKEPSIFKIYVPQDVVGIAYISDFLLNNEVNDEEQTLINIGTKFEILNVDKDSNGVNIWSLKMLT